MRRGVGRNTRARRLPLANWPHLALGGLLDRGGVLKNVLKTLKGLDDVLAKQIGRRRAFAVKQPAQPDQRGKKRRHPPQDGGDVQGGVGGGIAHVVKDSVLTVVCQGKKA